MMKKICSKCKEWKDHSEFGKNKSRADGLTVYCLVCKNAAIRAWRRGDKEANVKQRLKEILALLRDIKEDLNEIKGLEGGQRK